LILLFIQLHFIKPYFLVNDDIYKVFLAKGIGMASTPTPYFILSSILLGLFFVKCYAWFPSFPSYSLFLCAVQFLSLWAFLWVLCLRPSRWVSVVLFLVSCLGVEFIFFTYLQFTQTASMAAASGVLVFIFSTGLPPGGRRLGAWVFSGALFVSSWLLRPDSFLLILLASAPLALVQLKQANLRALKQQWKFVSTVVALVFLAAGLQFAWFQKHRDWKDFQRFAVDIQRIVEFQAPLYSPKTKPVFDSAGWSENDYWFFRNWYFMDPEKFSVSNLDKLRAGFPRADSEGKRGSFHSLMDLFDSYWDLRILLYFFVFLAFCRGNVFRFLLAQWAWISLIFLFLIYFMKATDRVTLPLLAYLMNLAIYGAEPPFSKGGRKGSTPGVFLPWARAALLGGAFLLAFPNLENYYLQNLEKQRVEYRLKSCLQQLRPSDKQLYIMLEFPFEAFNAFDDFECFQPFRIFFASAMERCPAQMETLENFKIEDPFKEAVDNPNILMICTTEEGLHYHTYMLEHFRKNVFARRVFDGGYFKVFTLHSRP
jgi:hypothetical protein